METTKKVTIDIFDFKIYFYIGNIKGFKRYYKKIIGLEYGNDIDDNWYGLHQDFVDKRVSFVVVFDDNEELIATIIHEITHAQQGMLKYMNIEHDYYNTELVANIMEYLVQIGIKLCDIHTKKLKKGGKL